MCATMPKPSIWMLSYMAMKRQLCCKFVMMALGLIRIYCATISIIPVWRRWQLKPKSIMGRLKFNRNLKRVQPSPCGLRGLRLSPSFR